MPSSAALLAPPAAQFLYAASLFYKLSEYAPGTNKPLRSITLKNGNGFVSLAVNAAGYVFTETGNISSAHITLYDAQTLKRVRRLDGIWAAFLLADGNGYIYAANCGDGIVVIAPDRSKVVNVIYHQVRNACTLALDDSSELFVADQGAVSVYSPTKRPGFVKYLRSIKKGIRSPRALALGPDGELFVANRDYVSVYLPGASSPIREISADIKQASSLALDSAGRFCVASSPFTVKGYQPGWITVYGPQGKKPLRKITSGVDQPVSLAIDRSDNLYVANDRGDAVTVYSPGGTKLLSKITSGVHDPVAITIAPH